jgi:hypothetical protein
VNGVGLNDIGYRDKEKYHRNRNIAPRIGKNFSCQKITSYS